MAKEVEKKERLEHEKTKLAATQKEVKDAKKKHAAIAGENSILFTGRWVGVVVVPSPLPTASLSWETHATIYSGELY